MKISGHVIVLIGLLFILELGDASLKRRQKKVSGRHRLKASHENHMDAAESDPEIENELETRDDLLEGLQDSLLDNQQSDPCLKRRCGSGQVCRLTEDGEAMCTCIPECPPETNPRRKVCSNMNETWDSDCDLSQMRCWCQAGDSRCTDIKLKHMHIHYFGYCKNIEVCTEDQMLDFPRRMRDWLFHIMRDMADREELTPYYYKLEREAESNLTRRWNTAAVWKWCDLDQGHDRFVSRHELFPIEAPLIAMEHCIGPFLDKCDANGDHKLSLSEWTKCLELNEDEIEDHCEDIRDNEDLIF